MNYYFYNEWRRSGFEEKCYSRWAINFNSDIFVIFRAFYFLGRNYQQIDKWNFVIDHVNNVQESNGIYCAARREKLNDEDKDTRVLCWNTKMVIYRWLSELCFTLHVPWMPLHDGNLWRVDMYENIKRLNILVIYETYGPP